MPDISMCVHDHCPLARGCYRHMAIPHGLRQSWAPFYFKVEGSKTTCDAYWPIAPGQRNVRPGAVPGKPRGKRARAKP